MSGYLAVDLGSTNLKVIAYNEEFTPLRSHSEPVCYHREGELVEFDAAECFQSLLRGLRLCGEAFPPECRCPKITLTGQAESLVLSDAQGTPVRPAISWMDGRGGREAEEIQAAFPGEESCRITGQLSVNTSWPAVNLLWLRRQEPEVLQRADWFFLLKDYMLFRLTGKAVGEYSCYSFSYYFDYVRKCYWEPMLRFCGIPREKLPQLVPPGTAVGTLLPEIARKLGFSGCPEINAGALDHFCGMIGSGNVREGLISESTGTVLAMAALSSAPARDGVRIPCHCGPFPGSYVFLSVCESGGDSLEWFRNAFLPEYSFAELDEALSGRQPPEGLFFLPYLQGVSAPEYDPGARGVFYGIQRGHNRLDFAYAVMEGVAQLLCKNIRLFPSFGEETRLLSTGGGAKSDFWSQLKADVCGVPVDIPENGEAACFGAALLGAGTAEAADAHVRIRKSFEPDPVRAEQYAARHQAFCRIYQKLF